MLSRKFIRKYRSSIDTTNGRVELTCAIIFMYIFSLLSENVESFLNSRTLQAASSFHLFKI